MLQFFPPEVHSTASSLFSAYASFAALMMMVRSVTNDLIPQPVRSYLQSILNYLFTPISSSITIVVDEQCGITRNEVYDAAEVYLRTRISPSTERFKVSKSTKDKNLNVSIEENEEIRDTFQSFQLVWRFVHIEPQNGGCGEKRFFELTFNKKFKEIVLKEYLPFVLDKAKEIKEDDKVVKLYTTDCPSYDDDGYGVWGSTNLDHPSTFETLAMDPEMKKAIIEDLDRFVRRKGYYKKVGKAWKRGYLLYGPPGTGKSSLIAAMANYLKFDVYDLELTSVYSDLELRRILVSTTNRSIIVIEDIDCSAEMENREHGNRRRSDSKLTLSGLLNFIDGLWSSCGDERIFVFTTNHKDKLDPALLRPGRMDLHIHMSYCTYQGFRLLASNYLGVNGHHRLFGEIEDLIQNVQVTPAVIAEELMKNEDADIALLGLVNLLKTKKVKVPDVKEENAITLQGNDIEAEETDGSEFHEVENFGTGEN